MLHMLVQSRTRGRSTPLFFQGNQKEREGARSGSCFNVGLGFRVYKGLGLRVYLRQTLETC